MLDVYISIFKKWMRKYDNFYIDINKKSKSVKIVIII